MPSNWEGHRNTSIMHTSSVFKSPRGILYPRVYICQESRPSCRELVRGYKRNKRIEKASFSHKPAISNASILLQPNRGYPCKPLRKSYKIAPLQIPPGRINRVFLISAIRSCFGDGPEGRTNNDVNQSDSKLTSSFSSAAREGSTLSSELS